MLIVCLVNICHVPCSSVRRDEGGNYTAIISSVPASGGLLHPEPPCKWAPVTRMPSAGSEQSPARMRDCRLRALVERAGDIIWTVDMTMRPTYISPSIQRHLGYTASEGMKLNMEDVFSPESYRQAMLLLAAELARDNEPDLDPDRGSLLEIEMVHRDGHYVPFEVHYSAIRDNSGKPVEIVAIARNIATRRADEEFRTESTRRQLEALRQTVRSLAALGEMRDSYTAIHQRRVAVLACAIGEAIGLDTDALEGLRIAGLIHDIGKVRVPAEILTRPGRLTSAEIEIIKTHPYVGYQVLSVIDRK